jgi:hypothetical protein
MKPADWHDDMTYRHTITVTMCRACVEDGTAKALAKEIERIMRKSIEDRFNSQMRGQGTTVN